MIISNVTKKYVETFHTQALINLLVAQEEKSGAHHNHHDLGSVVSIKGDFLAIHALM